MRVLKQNPWLPGLGVLLAALVVAGYARADVTTDQPGSIVIFPKVISDGTRDTLIQLTNTTTSSRNVHCVYVDTSSASPGTCSGTTPAAQSCSTDQDCFATSNGFCIICQPFDFDLTLTPLQPTVWRVSAGRDSSDQSAGIFLGAITAHPLFQGELKCFETDDSGVPSGGNSLKGEATIENLNTEQVSEYNGIAIQALPGLASGGLATNCVGGGNAGATCSTNNDCSCTSNPGLCAPGATDGVCSIVLNLDNSTDYNACPSQLLVNHYAEGAEDPAGATVHSELTLVPCTEALESGSPTTTSVTFNPYNEAEVPGPSAIVPFTCWLNLGLDDARLSGSLTTGVLASTYAKTRVFPSNATVSGILGVIEEFHTVTGENTGTAAANLHVTGSRPGDTITLPAGQ